MHYKVIFARRAGDQLADLYSYVAEKAGERIAERFIAGIHQLCLGLADFPHRGTLRESVVPNLRIIGFRRAATIAYSVDDDSGQVMILGVYYRGRDVGHDLDLG